MPDNLTVTIGADSSKLRAELALVSQATKTAQKELNALAATFNKTGADADRMRLDAKARQLDQYKRAAVDLNKQIATLSPTFRKVGTDAEHAASGLQEFIHSGRGLGRVISEFSNLTRGLESFSGIFGATFGGFAGGLAGVGIARVFGALVEQINKVTESITELRRTSADIGLKPIQVQAAREVVKGIGEEADVADKALQGMAAQFDKIRAASTQQPGQAATVLRGGVGGLFGQGAAGVQIMRGGAAKPLDFGDPLALLGIKNVIAALPLTELGKLQGYLITLKAFQEQASKFDATALNQISKALFQGVPSNSMLEAAPALLRDWESQIRKLQVAARGVTPEIERQNQELLASQERLSQSYSNTINVVRNSLVPARTAINEVLQGFFDRATVNLPKFDAEWTAFAHSLMATWRQAMLDIESASSATWAAFSSGASAAAEGFKSIWQTTIEWLSNALSTVVSAAKSAAASIANTTAAGGGDISLGFASGGMVRGFGSGTSDSILARLSNGEFVMRAAAVQHWGPQFLAALNGLRNPGFALGGLVSSLPRGFADGGLAGAGGTPVHLHLGGNSFALSGNDSVVSALVVEAHRQQMRSAGTKPSWFAARPGGR